MTKDVQTEPSDGLNEQEISSAFVDAMSGRSESPPATPAEGSSDANAGQAEPETAGQDDPGTGQEAGGAVAQSTEGDQSEQRPPVHLESLLQAAREHGISVEGVTSEKDLEDRVFGQIRRMQGILASRQEAEARQSAHQPPPAQQPEQVPGQWDKGSYFSEKYGGPVWKEEYNAAIQSGMVVRDENGLWRSSPGYEGVTGKIADEINAAQNHASSFWRNLTQSNPYEQIYNVLSDPIERMVQERVDRLLEEKIQQSQRQTAVSRFESENQSWMYRTDPDTGRNVLTENGQRFVDVVTELRADGISDPAVLVRRAQQLTGYGVGGQGNAPQAAAAPVQRQSVAPVAKAAGAPRQEAQQQSFLENAQRAAQYTPSARGRASEDGPQVMSDGDLESLFIRAQREASTV